MTIDKMQTVTTYNVVDDKEPNGPSYSVVITRDHQTDTGTNEVFDSKGNLADEVIAEDILGYVLADHNKE
jgi:hypothetical protein